MASIASTSMTTRSSHCEVSPRAFRPAKVASAVKAPTVNTSPCENWMTSSTPKKSVKPTATSAYIMPSMSPFMTYCANSPRSMFLVLSGKAGPRITRPRPGLLLARQLALAGSIFAIVPFDELAILNDVFRDHGHGVLAVVVERDLTDNRGAVFDVCRDRR